MTSVNSIFGGRSPRPPDIKEQYLFLLEFFVHQITGERLAKLNQMFFVPTSVCFKFLSFTEEDIEVTPVDPMFEPQAGIADEVEYFYSGRSVMFAVDRTTLFNGINEFKVDIKVQKKMPDDIRPDILIGEGSFDLGLHFAALRKEIQQCWHTNVPPPKTFEGEVPLKYNQDHIGDVCLFARMSAFGQTIVTEFDAPKTKEKTSAFVFKGEESSEKGLVYKCRRIESSDVDVCKDSQEDVQESACPVCLPKKFPCSPCGVAQGAMARPSSPAAAPAGYSVVPVGQVEPAECGTQQGKQPGPIQTSRGPAQLCGRAVVLKVSGLLDAEEDTQGNLKQPTVTVAPECDAIPPDADPDPDHDVFILRIGKKGLVGIGEKSDIQLEMKTPKGPERRPPIRYETREMQTEAAADDKKGKKGGKKKKK
ncbi:uncharacterized protein LOC105702736 [Orussus abietinus]|uniref:uncharacterized protein LOC105702736 n=1 Tax=Orussus abietinus TaxID=222816 RepID=UPI0006262F41|nr:uncharacterized protein LOC105702736 [Orussus abietinus]